MKKNKKLKSIVDIKLDEKDIEISLLELKMKVGSPKHIYYRRS
tara:strand:+ start:826 stop:954 length:129 start_codon:yes stop_codon:yes gene_type:complete